MTGKNPLLRDYQQEIIARVHQEWKHHQSVMVQMPTGTGKTHVLAGIVSAFKGEILIVAHRRELVEQIGETLRKWSTEHGELKNESEQFSVRVESIQTVSRRIKKDEFNFTPILVIIDEAHHALAKTYRILWEKWPKAKFLGLTATPCRMNHAGFTDLFDSLVSSWIIAEFIRQGVLSVFDYAAILPGSTEQRLIDSLQKRGADGDFQIKEMEAVLNRRPSIESLYRSIHRFAQGKKGIVYAISIGHAQHIAEYYQAKGIRSVAIDSRTPKEERRRMVDAFKQGEIQVLVNVDIFSEGFDCPDVEFIQMARPTLSLSKYLQQVGRGLRKSKGKESCILIDNVGLCRLFGLPIQGWDWAGMFRGEMSGKGRRLSPEHIHNKQVCYRTTEGFHDTLHLDAGMELVISHETLLEKLKEPDTPQIRVEKSGELRTWLDSESCLWGLRKGRMHTTKAEYTEVFDIKEGVAAVRFQDYNCGLVNEDGMVLWKGKRFLSMRMTHHKFVEIKTEMGATSYLDMHSLKCYLRKPEVKRYGSFELLRIKDTCYSRTKRRYASKTDFESLVVVDKGHFLSIYESTTSAWEAEGTRVCLLKGDMEEYYHIQRWLPDESVIISDGIGKYYHLTKEGRKEFIGIDKNVEKEICLKKIALIEKNIIQSKEAVAKEKRERILKEHNLATPFQSGVKWGLKVGNRITIPPIYKSLMPPIGKYCAVEKNHSQWGIVSIDGTMLVEPKYPEVFIAADGTARLTQVTGNKIKITLK